MALGTPHPPARLPSLPPQPSSSTDTLQVETLNFPPLTKQHVKNCAFSSWHKRYKKLTPRATVIKPVGEGFVQYLLSDGIFLPPEGEPAEWSSDSDFDDDATGLATRIQELGSKTSSSKASQSDSESDDDEEIDWDGEDDANNNDPATAFPDLDKRVREVLADYQAATPKLNWSSPRDATWITTTNSLKCVTPGDVYLILKSSNFITHDLLHPFEDCISTLPSHAASSTPSSSPRNGLPSDEVELILRKWVDFNPSMEFRVFVRRRRILGISQRAENYYEFLEPLRDRLTTLLQGFFDEKLRDTFPDENFCFDAYIPKPEQTKVWLIDINPFAARTDALMFSWVELLRIDPNDPEFTPELRLVSEDEGVHSFSTKPFSAHMVPRDVVDASVQGGGAGIAAFAKKWQEMLEKSGSGAEKDEGERDNRA
ncbi:D123-domain-containing protein [Lipomyces kononenkoae]|uniref:D123-domain-containing protein n=1 Tax=Lipomyces kononenkoae TaxID=34357 RepID=A0ACC3TBF2_LIPKO